MNSTTSASPAILIDTNVLVYIHDPRDRTKQDRAIEVIERLVTEGRAATSVQCLSEFFNSVTRRLPDPMPVEDAVTNVERFSQLLRVVDLTEMVVLTGCRATTRHQMSLWDALIWSAASVNRISVILTEDLQHELVIDGVRYVNPFVPEFDLQAP